ncbi:MAG: HIT family protein [Gammaproteobacteria bacterium]|nr:HIT family protein [Gammaproteobacteria bacterium]
MTIANVPQPCVFCNPAREVLAENALALAFYDINPVSPGHALIVPRQHFRTIFDAAGPAYAACFELAREVQEILVREHSPAGFNLGINCETAGGQSVWHAHIHLIPRYLGDVEDPLGGVRNVIPRKR